MSGGAPGLAVIDRACSDCHSYRTVWPWYTGIAPASWLIVHDVNEAREAVNFSEWGTYSREQQAKQLKEACDEVTEGEMPLSTYVLLHPGARLADGDVRAICSLSQLD